MPSTVHLTRPGQQARESASRPSARRRDPWLDNAKMALVTLVVVGHSWVLLPDSVVKHWFYDFLYLWHVPAFVLVTGYLSRSFAWTRPHLTRLLTTVLVPYLIFEGLLAAFRVGVGGEKLDGLFADPHWPMWYLAVLFLWRLATPLLRSPRALPITVAVAVLGGLVPAELFDVSRATGLLPFFTLGLLARREHLEILRTRAARVTGVLLLAVGFVLVGLVDGRMQTEWLYWRSSYAELGATFTEGALIKTGLLVVGTVLGLAFLTLVPARGSWFSRLGAATLVVYLFHGFVVKSAEYAGPLGWADGPLAWVGLLVTATLSVVLALGLAAPPVARRLNLLVDPIGTLRRR